MQSCESQAAEYAVIKTHPEVGMRMLAGHSLAVFVRYAVLLHQERIDGGGYPRGLGGELIPAIARIVSICDAFDAMTSHRPYREGMLQAKALNIIQDGMGVQFDQRFSEAFIFLGKQGHLKYVIGHSDDGIPLQSCPMFGPTLVLRRGQEAEDRIDCRNCSGEFELEHIGDGLKSRPTGGKGDSLEPEADTELIKRTVSVTVEALPSHAVLVHEPVIARNFK